LICPRCKKRERLPGYSKCEPCLNQNQIYMRNKRAKDRAYRERELDMNRQRRERYELEGRCRRCSRPLDPDRDMGNKECLICYERKRYAEI
jgi:hypothetical protein